MQSSAGSNGILFCSLPMQTSEHSPNQTFKLIRYQVHLQSLPNMDVANVDPLLLQCQQRPIISLLLGLEMENI